MDNRVLIDLPSDIEGLTKKLDVESFQVIPKSTYVNLNGSVVYFSGERELRETNSSNMSINISTPNNDTAHELTAEIIKKIIPLIKSFYLDSVKREEVTPIV